MNPFHCVTHNHCISVMQSRFLILIKNLVVCCYHSPKNSATKILSARSSGFLLHGALVTFVRLQTSQLGSWRKWVNKLRFLPDLFEVGFAGGCAERGIAGRWYGHVSWTDVCRTSRYPCSSFREWLKPLWYYCLFFARSRPQLVFASDRPELWSGVRLLARPGSPKNVCRWYTRCFSHS